MAEGGWESILLIRLSSLGDVARMLPSLRALKAGGAARVDLTTEDRFVALLGLFPLADHVVPYPRKGPGSPLRSPLAWSAAMGRYLGTLRESRYDLALDLHGILRSALVARASGARETAGYAKGFGREGSHLLYGRKVVPANDPLISRYERYAGTLAALGLPRPGPEYMEPAIPAEASEEVRLFLGDNGLEAGKYLFAFVGTSRAQAHKRWPLGRFAELAGLAGAKLGLPTVLGWGPDEALEAASLRGREGVHLIPDWRLPCLLEVIRRSAAFVGADTGAMHLAALMGVPTAAVLGPTDPVLNRPFGDRARIVRRDGIARVCRGEGCPHADCMGAIPAAEVLGALEELLGRA